jgi:hypothetical protein
MKVRHELASLLEATGDDRDHVSTVIATHMTNAAVDARRRAKANVGRKGFMRRLPLS